MAKKKPIPTLNAQNDYLLSRVVWFSPTDLTEAEISEALFVRTEDGEISRVGDGYPYHPTAQTFSRGEKRGQIKSVWISDSGCGCCGGEDEVVELGYIFPPVKRKKKSP